MSATINYCIAATLAGLAVGVTILIGAFLPTPIVCAVVVAVSMVSGLVYGLLRIPRLRRGLEERVLTETGARLAEPHEFPRVSNLLEGLAIAANVPVPRFAIISDPVPNSFGVGIRPQESVIGVTTGLIEALTRDELEAVLAYEVSRIASLDVALASWTVALTWGAIRQQEKTEAWSVRVLTWFPSRRAEWLQVRALRDQAEERDLAAVRFTRHPYALIRALEVLHEDKRSVQGASRATAPLWIEFPYAAVTAVDSPPAQVLAMGFEFEKRIARLRRVVSAIPDLRA